MAGESAGNDVDSLDGGEVNFADILVVWDPGEVDLEDFARSFVELAVPNDLSPGDGGHGEIKSAVARE